MGNTFTNNHAFSEGGAIKWKEVEPFLWDNNNFINNSAIYGNNDAAFPFRIEMEINNSKEQICFNQSKDCISIISNVGSGSPLNISFKFIVKDIYNQTIESLTGEY